MTEHSRNRDTGRVDKYSDETPLKDYQDYRKDFPNDNKEPRKIAKDISGDKITPRHIGPKSFEARRQELISHIQNYRETFNAPQKNVWENKLGQLIEAFKHG